MDKMCVYCGGIYTADTIVCPTCNELDGLMPVAQAVKYSGLDESDYPNYFDNE